MAAVLPCLGYHYILILKKKHPGRSLHQGPSSGTKDRLPSVGYDQLPPVEENL